MAELLVHLVSGGDERLVAAALDRLVAEVLGDGDAALEVQEFRGPDYALADVVDAVATPPFLVPRRIVVARDLEQFAAPELAVLAERLVDHPDFTVLVLAFGQGTPPKKLVDAVKAAGGTRHSTGAPNRPRDVADWVRDQADAHGVELDRAAGALLVDHLGEDTGRLPELFGTLGGAFAPGSVIGVDELMPFLGEAGGVPPWELTDPIDRGDIAGALDAARRMLHGGDRHPLQVMATLTGHVRRLLQLDGSGVRSDQEAAALLGLTSAFPAKKALAQARRLGHDGVVRLVALVADADADLRGRSGLDEETVMQVLVARMAQTSGRR